LVNREDVPTSVDCGFEWMKRKVSPWLSIIRNTKGLGAFMDLLDYGEEKFNSKRRALINDYWELRNGTAVREVQVS